MTTNIPVIKHILSANDQIAEQNLAALNAAGVYAINIMASPGAGKTSTIIKTFELLENKIKMGVIEGDLASSIDADKAQAAGIPVVQINTGGGCHLDAVMLQGAFPNLPLDSLDLVIVENVGNLVCPANFKIGTHKNVLIASIPEGDDKPYKYPGMYQGVDALIINKIDLMPYIDFDIEYFLKGVEILNPGLKSFSVSCKTGEGFDSWIDWLTKQIEEQNG
jgi:hydrogenase nickel incorporation protein HypB